MVEYIPNTTQVRAVYSDDYDIAERAFDRWLSEHTRKAKEVAWNEGMRYSDTHLECDLPWDSGETCDGCPTCKPINPYTKKENPND